MAEPQARSLAQIEVPICSACRIAMIWYRSIRADSNSAVRLFYCPKCNEIGRSKQKIESGSSNARSFRLQRWKFCRGGLRPHPSWNPGHARGRAAVTVGSGRRSVLSGCYQITSAAGLNRR